MCFSSTERCFKSHSLRVKWFNFKDAKLYYTTVILFTFFFEGLSLLYFSLRSILDFSCLFVFCFNYNSPSGFFLPLRAKRSGAKIKQKFENSARAYQRKSYWLMICTRGFPPLLCHKRNVSCKKGITWS